MTTRRKGQGKRRAKRRSRTRETFGHEPSGPTQTPPTQTTQPTRRDRRTDD